MLITAWSAKGGAGTTVVAVGLAAALADRGVGEVLLVDLGGDLPAAVGVAEPTAGLTDWLAAGSGVTLDSLRRVEVPTPLRRVRLLPRGSGATWDPDRVEALAGLMAAEDRTVVVDAGLADRLESGPSQVADALAALSDVSLLVTRACYLAMRRALQISRRPDGVVIVREPGRALDVEDVQRLLDAPVVAKVDVDPAVARLVDAGLLAARPPRALTKSLRRVA